MNEGKLKPRVKKCIFLGYASSVERYRLWRPNLKAPKLLISRDVTFDESAILLEKEQVPEKTTKEIKTTMKKVELKILDQGVDVKSI